MARNSRRPRIVLAVLGISAVVIAVGVVWFIPRDRPASLTTRVAEPNAAARMRMTVESVDGAKGTMKVRLQGGPTGRPLPPEGLSIFTDIDSVSTVKLQPANGPQEATMEIPLEEGAISAYPFDTYETSVRLSAERGNPDRPSWGPAESIPIDVEAYNAAVGFDVNVDAKDEGNNSTLLTFEIDRTTPVVTWVSIMMMVYWLLSLAVIGVTALVVMRQREWESRHLAWLAAMIFAFASFLATAPNSPPVGVYLDYAAFFWAEAIIAVSLTALVGFYMVGLHKPDDSGPNDAAPRSQNTRG